MQIVELLLRNLNRCQELLPQLSKIELKTGHRGKLLRKTKGFYQITSIQHKSYRQVDVYVER